MSEDSIYSYKDYEFSVAKCYSSAFVLELNNDINKLLSFLPEKSKILDVGCGYGIPTSLAAEHYNMTACDVPEFGGKKYQKEFISMLMKMRGIEHKWIEIYDSTLILPFADDSFDGILLYAVIEHVIEKEILLQECCRVLKPQGKIFVFRAVNKFSFSEKLAKLLNLASHGNEVVTGQQLRKVFTNTGFFINKMGYQGWLPEIGLPKWPIYLINKLLTHIPIINTFSHDYWLIATKQTKIFNKC